MKSSTFLLYIQAAPDERALDANELPWHNADDKGGPLSRPPFAIDESRTLWGVVRPHTGALEEVGQKENAAFALRVVRTPGRSYVALLPLIVGILVNGLPALGMTLLSARDSVVLAAGCLAYITERRHAFRGKPDREWIGQACQYCRIKITAATLVVVCPRCQCLYHDEDEKSHPEAAQRLDCYRQVKNCLNVACRRQLSLEPQLVWDPRQF